MKKSEYEELTAILANVADRAGKVSAAMTELADEMISMAKKMDEMRPK